MVLSLFDLFCTDQMLKERFLNNKEEDAIEENFTDDEESGDEADGAGEFPRCIHSILRTVQTNRSDECSHQFCLRTTNIQRKPKAMTMAKNESRSAWPSILLSEPGGTVFWASLMEIVSFRGPVD